VWEASRLEKKQNVSVLSTLNAVFLSTPPPSSPPPLSQFYRHHSESKLCFGVFKCKQESFLHPNSKCIYCTYVINSVLAKNSVPCFQMSLGYSPTGAIDE
jgi:hypothetical protein